MKEEIENITRENKEYENLDSYIEGDKIVIVQVDRDEFGERREIHHRHNAKFINEVAARLNMLSTIIILNTPKK